MHTNTMRSLHHALITLNVFSFIAKKNGCSSPLDTAVCPLFIVIGLSHCSSNFGWLNSLYATAAIVIRTAVTIYPHLPPLWLSFSTTVYHYPPPPQMLLSSLSSSLSTVIVGFVHCFCRHHLCPPPPSLSTTAASTASNLNHQRILVH
jgi:hypothetical protein